MIRLVALVLLSAACSSNRSEGQPCDEHDDCLGELVCREGRCAVDPALHERMAKQSGVEVSSERGSAAEGPGAVRVRTAAGYEYAAAVCNGDERLLGGWCDPVGTQRNDSTIFTKAGARDYSDTDTVGAKWTCQVHKLDVRAYAMCQRLQ